MKWLHFSQRMALTLIGVFATVVIVIRLQPSDTPFLYYYSAERGAFIVERADSSDRRILTEFTIPASCYEGDSCNIVGPGWSPSGNWFAWTVSNNAAAPPEGATASVVSRDGNKLFTLLDGLGGVGNLHWSPTDDLLFFERHVPETYDTYEYYVWDAQRQAIAFTLDETSFAEVEWTPDGQYLVVYSPLQDDEGTSMRVLAKDGGIVAQRTIASLSEYFTYYACTPEWSNDGKVVYVGLDQKLVVEDFGEGTRIEFDFTGGYLNRVDWSPEGDYAFVYAGGCYPIQQDTSLPLWLLSVNNPSLVQLASSARVSFRSSFFYPTSTWSPQGNAAIFIPNPIPRSEEEKISLVTLTPFQVIDIILNIERLEFFLYRPEFVRWLDGDVFAYFGVTEAGNNAIYQYQVSSGEQMILAEGETITSNFALSNTGRYLASSSRNCNGVCVEDLETGEEFSLEMQFSISELTGAASELLWHPTQNWLFMTGYPVASGRWLNVANADGSFVRELPGWYHNVPSSYGWLPDVRDLHESD